LAGPEPEIQATGYLRAALLINPVNIGRTGTENSSNRITGGAIISHPGWTGTGLLEIRGATL